MFKKAKINEHAGEILDEVYVIPVKISYGSILGKIENNAQKYWRRNKINFYNEIITELNFRYDQHKLNDCKKGDHCPYIPLYQNIFNNVMESLDEVKKSKPWYKETWAYIIGFVTLLGTLIVATNNFTNLYEKMNAPTAEEVKERELTEELHDFIVGELGKSTFELKMNNMVLSGILEMKEITKKLPANILKQEKEEKEKMANQIENYRKLLASLALKSKRIEKENILELIRNFFSSANLGLNKLQIIESTYKENPMSDILIKFDELEKGIRSELKIKNSH